MTAAETYVSYPTDRDDADDVFFLYVDVDSQTFVSCDSVSIVIVQSAHSKLHAVPKFIRSVSYNATCSDLIACFGLNPSGSTNTCLRVCPVNIQREPAGLSFLSVRLSVDLIVNVICWCPHNMKPPGFTG